MSKLRQGDHEAIRQLFELLYPELRRLAAVKMRSERADHSWQPTVLVNELYLELLKVKSLRGGGSAEGEKAEFFRLAAFLMRRLLIHHARPLSRRSTKVALVPDLSGYSVDHESLADIETALNRLDGINPALRCVVEMRVFEGHAMEDIAVHLGCSAKTVSRHWSFAQRWLHEALQVPGDRVRS